MIHVLKEIDQLEKGRKAKKRKERKEGGEKQKLGREEGRKKSTKYPDIIFLGMRCGIRVKYHSYNTIKACN